jgi:hypothetical protein
MLHGLSALKVGSRTTIAYILSKFAHDFLGVFSPLFSPSYFLAMPSFETCAKKKQKKSPEHSKKYRRFDAKYYALRKAQTKKKLQSRINIPKITRAYMQLQDTISTYSIIFSDQNAKTHPKKRSSILLPSEERGINNKIV